VTDGESKGGECDEVICTGGLPENRRSLQITADLLLLLRDTVKLQHVEDS